MVGLPGYLYNRLQLVLNAAARSIAGLRLSDHITDTLASFHWLKAPKRVQYKLATVVYRSLNGAVPSYLAAPQTFDAGLTCRPHDVCGHHRAGCPPVAMCNCWRPNLRRVAGAPLWNSLPPDIVACDTLSWFRRELKTFLFRQSDTSVLFYFSLVVILA